MDTSRNGPCPCGSGVKYKKCCLVKDEAARKPHTGEDAVIVCMPTRGQICYETHLALCMNLRDVQTCNMSVGRKPVAEARNVLAKRAIEVAKENPFSFTPREVFALWLDDDAWWPPGMVSNMLRVMRLEPTIDALFAKFGARKPYSEPLALRHRHNPMSFPDVGVNCGPTDIVDIERAGMHFCLMRLSLLERLGDNPFDIIDGLGEDYSFCDRATAIGARLAIAMQMPALHLDADTGLAYVPGMPAVFMDGNEARSIEPMLADSLREKSKRHTYGEPQLDNAETAVAQHATAHMRGEVRKRLDMLRVAST